MRGKKNTILNPKQRRANDFPNFPVVEPDWKACQTKPHLLSDWVAKDYTRHWPILNQKLEDFHFIHSQSHLIKTLVQIQLAEINKKRKGWHSPENFITPKGLTNIFEFGITEYSIPIDALVLISKEFTLEMLVPVMDDFKNALDMHAKTARQQNQKLSNFDSRHDKISSLLADLLITNLNHKDLLVKPREELVAMQLAHLLSYDKDANEKTKRLALTIFHNDMQYLLQVLHAWKTKGVADELLTVENRKNFQQMTKTLNKELGSDYNFDSLLGKA